MKFLWAAIVGFPSWTLVAQLDNVEIRQYEAVIQARTSIESNSESSGGFRTLADYIFGGNAQEQSIAMTAPVEESLSGDEAYMAFTMPSQYSLEEYEKKVGWGHCSMEIAAELSVRAKAKRLVMFHHDPAQTDKDRSNIFKKFMSTHTYDFPIELAVQGHEIEV